MPNFEGAARAGKDEWPALPTQNHLTKEGWLLPFGPATRRYNPLAHPQLPAEFAKLAMGDNPATITFANTWGLPTFDQTLSHDVPADYKVGERLDFVHLHARTIDFILRLIAFGSGVDDDETLRNYVETTAIERESGGRGLELAVGEHAHILPLASHDLTGLTQEAIPLVVNSNCEFEPRIAYVLQAGQKRPTAISTQLLPAIYAHCAQLTHGDRLRRCRHCGQIFVQTDQRQSFCPPPSPWHGSGESLCAALFRKARIKEDEQGEVEDVGS